MHHDTPLITTIVAGLVLAYIFGMIAHRLKMPPLVGYLFAGVLAGPYTPGFVADQALGAELAELGVILLMFGVGLHFSLKDLMSVRALAIPGALAQIALATLLGLGLALILGWGVGAGILFGLALSVASTVVLLKALQDRRLIETERGRIAVGWLIVEDLAMVLALVLVPAIASLGGNDSGVHDPFVSFVSRMAGIELGIWGVLSLTLVKVAAFVGFMLIVGRRIIPWALHGTAHTGSRELFRLAVLAIALGVALGSALLFGVSLALGAFFAGMILSESELSHRAAQETLPLRDAFAVLFFVSVGMLFDPMIIITNPLPVLATVFIIIIGKSAAAFGIVLLFKRPIATALTISASLAQIGEFSFILASMGVALAILPREGQDLILAGALISIVLNPVVFWAIDLAKPKLEAKSARRKAARAERNGERIEPDSVEPTEAVASEEVTEADVLELVEEDVIEPSQKTGHTVLVGFGRVGKVVGESLHSAGAPLVLIEDTDHFVAVAREMGIETVLGNAASEQVLELANLAAAECLLIAIPDGFEAGTVCEVGRKLSPSIRIIARAHSAEEEEHLRSLGADVVIMGEHEIGMGMLAWLRGERVAPVVAEAVVVEPKLAPVDNLLAKAATTPAAVASAVATTDERETPETAERTTETEPEGEIPVLEAVVVDDVIELAPPAEQADTPASQDDAAEVTVDEVGADAAAELDEQKADEVSEGGPAPASEDADTAEDGVAPEVQPEPKS
ncbi:cation:proton antiporter [Devosia sp. BSSL-BM10]|uniref:Cation:proton antiporter n=1 Tax=Devosia litorisediminis TaxID=2829817 RepID=A0A942EFA7_9HYPH|nr:cation:proton antiporter [Devosia litorisediminis]